MNRSQTRYLVLTALCVALGVVLPVATHGVPNAAKVLLPMHIPVLLCGLITPWPFGLACGVLAPVLSSLITGMPPAAILPSMVCELAAYGLIASLLSRRVRLPRRTAELYVCLLGAMLLGRAVYGIMNALVFSAGSYGWGIFVSAAFVAAAPGIVIQLILIPPVILLLERARLIVPRPSRA